MTAAVVESYMHCMILQILQCWLAYETDVISLASVLFCFRRMLKNEEADFYRCLHRINYPV